MKKLFAILSACVLAALFCASAVAEGGYVLEEARFIEPMHTYEVRVSAACMPSDAGELPPDLVPDDDGLFYRQTNPGELFNGARAFSVSPDGETILFEFDGAWCALRGDEITLLQPNAARGVADEYGNFATFSKRPAASQFGGEGAVWSPDGRYFVLTDWLALTKGDFDRDLVVFDTVTGEYFLAATFPNRVTTALAGTVFQACFDESGRYLFYLVFGSMPNGRVALFRYDMESGENAMCCSGNEFASYPRLANAPGGRFVCLLDGIDASEKLGLNVYEEANGRWSNHPARFPLPLAEVKSYYMDASSESGWAIMLQKVAPGTVDEWNGLTRVNLNEGNAGLDEFVVIDALTAPSAVARGMKDALGEKGGAQCLGAQLSPDGQSALLLLEMNGAYALRVMDMASLKLTTVAVSDEILTSYAANGGEEGGTGYLPGIDWFAGDRVLINTPNGVRPYHLLKDK